MVQQRMCSIPHWVYKQQQQRERAEEMEPEPGSYGVEVRVPRSLSQWEIGMNTLGALLWVVSSVFYFWKDTYLLGTIFLLVGSILFFLGSGARMVYIMTLRKQWTDAIVSGGKGSAGGFCPCEKQQITSGPLT